MKFRCFGGNTVNFQGDVNGAFIRDGQEISNFGGRSVGEFIDPSYDYPWKAEKANVSFMNRIAKEKNLDLYGMFSDPGQYFFLGMKNTDTNIDNIVKYLYKALVVYTLNVDRLGVNANFEFAISEKDEGVVSLMAIWGGETTFMPLISWNKNDLLSDYFEPKFIPNKALPALPFVWDIIMISKCVRQLIINSVKVFGGDKDFKLSEIFLYAPEGHGIDPHDKDSIGIYYHPINIKDIHIGIGYPYEGTFYDFDDEGLESNVVNKDLITYNNDVNNGQAVIYFVNLRQLD